MSLLLGILPEQLRRDVISSRHVTTVSILFKLFVVFQPGGGAERTTLLKSLTEVKVGHSVTELLATMRQWRRWLQRAEELKVTLPDPLILMNVLGKIMDSLAKLGGSQVAYRVSTVRQELLVDQRPEMNSIKDLSEYLQAELEELALVAAVPKGAANTTSSPTTNEKTPVVKAMQSGTQEEKPRSPCKFWGTQHGCKRGDTCGYGHSWEGLDRQRRCFYCSGEGHMAKDCVHRQPKNFKDVKKAARLRGVAPEGSKEGPTKEKEVEVGSPGSTSTSSPSPLSPTTVSGGGLKDSGGGSPTKMLEEKPKNDIATDLIQEAATLLKTLRSVKTMRIKQISAHPQEFGTQGFALLDGGATHALRVARPEERAELFPVEVELAQGSTVLYRHPKHRTLLSLTEVEPIIPLGLLVERGFKVEWRRSGCSIHHPTLGPIPCWLRNGCPIMHRQPALDMLAQFEMEDQGEVALSDEDRSWWQKHFPELPLPVLQHMAGQSQEFTAPPWNRRLRRAHMTGKGVIVHLFSGADAKKWNDVGGGRYSWLCIDTEINAALNLHNPSVWSYLWKLASLGRIVAIIGGPPCRTVSRLRNKAPGPRRLRGRGEDRWCLPDLDDDEQRLAHGDTALCMKHIGLWLRAQECRRVPTDVGMLLESPRDPAEYLSDQEGAQSASFWCFPEITAWVGTAGLRLVTFDQGRLGHQRKKPTTVLTNLPAFKVLGRLGAGTCGCYQGIAAEVAWRFGGGRSKWRRLQHVQNGPCSLAPTHQTGAHSLSC